MKNLKAFFHYAINPKQAKAFVLVCLTWVLSLLVGCRSQSLTTAERYEAKITELTAQHEAEIEELVQQCEDGVYASRYLLDDWYPEAWMIGRWLGCLETNYPGLTAEAKALACWVIINRCESEDYPDDVDDVLYQNGQFEEFDDKAVLTEENATIAQNQIARWKNGDIRPTLPTAVYMSVSSEGVVLRDTYTETASTMHWRA
jgi:hypothetical protein